LSGQNAKSACSCRSVASCS